MSTATGPEDPGQFGLAVFGAGAAVVAWGSSGVVIRYIDMGGLAIAVYRFWIYALVLMAWMAARGVVVDRRIMRHTLWGGIALGLDVALFFSAVKETTIVNATIIGSMQPLVVGLVAWRFFGERIRGRQVLLGAMAMAAVVVVVMSGPETTDASLVGDVLAVGALLAWSAYFVFSKGSRTRLSPGEFTLGTALWTAMINTPLAVAFGQDLSLPSAEDWGWLVLLAFGAGIVGHVVMNWSLVRIPLWLGSTMTLLIPVSAAAMAWLVLDEPLSTAQLVAMGAVLVALALLVLDQSESRRAERTVGSGGTATDTRPVSLPRPAP